MLLSRSVVHKLFGGVSATASRGMALEASQLPQLPRRAILYLPGHDERKAAKAASLNVDCVCLDCEDAVGLSKKEDARKTVVKILSEVQFKSADVAVRINSPRTELAEHDLDALFNAPVLPRTLVVPKVNEPADLDWLFGKIAKKCSGMKKKPQIRLITMTESALGLLNLRSIIEFDQQELTESNILTHEGIIFGGDDYTASIGAVRSSSNKELLFARQCVVAHARAYNLQAIDVVNINYKDPSALAAEAKEGFEMGFTGKQIIHPLQVDVVQKLFCPTPEQITRAQAIVKAARVHGGIAAGAFAFEEQMIDLPTLKQCQNLLARAPLPIVVAVSEGSAKSSEPASTSTTSSTTSASTTTSTTTATTPSNSEASTPPSSSSSS